MALLAYNLTAASVVVAGTLVSLPASAAPPDRGKPVNVTSELRPSLLIDPNNGSVGGMDSAAFAAIQAQVAAGDLVIEWDEVAEYVVAGGLTPFVTRLIHLPIVTPSDSREQPGQGPVPIVYGSSMGLHFDTATDQAFRFIKIPSAFVSDATFHIHWTKAVNTNQGGATVRWKISYTPYPGDGVDINIAPNVITIDDTYDDAGTTTRIIYHTPDVAAPGFVARYYVGLMVEYVAASTTLVGGPVILSVDLVTRETITRGD